MTDFAAARRHMVDGQVRTAAVSDEAVVGAMLDVPREEFLPDAQRSIAYLDLEVEVTGGRSPARRLMTPMTLARLLQAADLDAGRKVLVVGCSTGYTVAIVARMGCEVTGTEGDSALAASARSNLSRLGIAGPTIVEADALSGCPDKAPFDVIFLDGAAAREPLALYDQMKLDGCLVGVFALTRPPQARKVVKSTKGIGYLMLFDATAPVLPGLERIPSFEF